MIVYIITCKITGKHYIGKTIKTLESRWKVAKIILRIITILINKNQFFSYGQYF